MIASLLEEIIASARAMEAEYGKFALEAQQTRARWQFMEAASPGRTVSQIARRLGTSRQAVQRIADVLVESGMARFAPNPDHRRSPIVRLTDGGTECLRRLRRRREQWERDLGENLEAELESPEIETAVHALRALRAML